MLLTTNGENIPRPPLSFSKGPNATFSNRIGIRLVWALGGTRHALVNLGLASLFREGKVAALLDRFEASLEQPGGSDFHRLEWPQFLAIIEQAAGGIPGWLSGWLASRNPPLRLDAA